MRPFIIQEAFVSPGWTRAEKTMHAFFRIPVSRFFSSCMSVNNRVCDSLEATIAPLPLRTRYEKKIVVSGYRCRSSSKQRENSG